MHSGIEPTRRTQENVSRAARTAQQRTANLALGIAFQHFTRVIGARESTCGAAPHPPVRKVHEAAPGFQRSLFHVGIGVESSYPGRRTFSGNRAGPA
ncbi:hypothetical protein ACXITP_00145 [Actinotignum sanguinis]|uniref:Uncharacterized protein n=1 Tax=Actinotignum sanguinis TaxID=1445614 RepID=A0ABT5V7W0_9ACTO|nr:hypothetical protein [Actinotignum sanguinis]MDE1657052.1 hypothetical protein [Actinotignum sanguinis]